MEVVVEDEDDVDDDDDEDDTHGWETVRPPEFEEVMSGVVSESLLGVGGATREGPL